MSGTTSLAGLSTSGAASLASLGVAGNSALAGLTTSGVAGLASLTVTGSSSLAGLTTSGAASLTSLSVSGSSSLAGLSTSGAASLASLSVTGDSALGKVRQGACSQWLSVRVWSPAACNCMDLRVLMLMTCPSLPLPCARPADIGDQQRRLGSADCQQHVSRSLAYTVPILLCGLMLALGRNLSVRAVAPGSLEGTVSCHIASWLAEQWPLFACCQLR